MSALWWNVKSDLDRAVPVGGSEVAEGVGGLFGDIRPSGHTLAALEHNTVTIHSLTRAHTQYTFSVQSLATA